MKKKKILIHSNNSRALTGFGKHVKNLLKYLYSTGKYELVEYSASMAWSDPSLKKLPWKAYGALPDDPSEMEKLNSNPLEARKASYGNYNINRVIQLEKPDVYLGVEDFWGVEYCLEKPWWNKINCIVHTTLDSLPLYPSAIENAKKIKHFFVWAKFAEEEMHRLGHSHVKLLHGCIDDKNFFKLPKNEKQNLRKKFNIPQDAYIIGFVFRNQLRKSVPNLLQGFKLFQKENPNVNAYLLFHTNWKEKGGWDIPRLIKENGIDPSKILTSYYCSECKNYCVVPYSGDELECPYCKNKSLSTPKVGVGLSEIQLNEVYNLMDVYCHAFTSGGQELPVQEAKLCELITLVTDYSCGTEYCTEESGGFPLDWSEYREPGTHFIKASTYPYSIAKQLKKIYNLKPDKKEELGKIARKFVLDNFSSNVIGKYLEEYIDSLPFPDYNFEFKSQNKNPFASIPDNLSNEEFIKALYSKVLNKDVSEKELKYWVDLLNKNEPRQKIEQHLRKIAFEENEKIKKIDLDEILKPFSDKTKILFVCPNGRLDAYLSTSLFESIKNKYVDCALIVVSDKTNFPLLEGSVYIDKLIENHNSIQDIDLNEKFDIIYAPNLAGKINLLNSKIRTDYEFS